MNPPILTSELLATWIANLTADFRCLWVVDRWTRIVSWKRRDEYSCFWEDSRFSIVFRQMEADLSNSVHNPNDIVLLCNLRSRVIDKYARYQTVHCWLYRWLFAGELTDAYHNLLRQIDASLIACVSVCDQIPDLGEQRVNLFTLLNSDPARNDYLFRFLVRFPEFLENIPPQRVVDNLSTIPINDLSYLSREQVNAVLPSINQPIFNDASMSSSSSSLFSSVGGCVIGARRLIAIGIEKLHEFGFLSQVNLGLFDQAHLVRFMGTRWDLLPELDIPSLEANLNMVPLEHLRSQKNDFLQQLSLGRLSVEAMKKIGFEKFSVQQILDKDWRLLELIQDCEFRRIDVSILTPSQIAFFFDRLSYQQKISINLSQYKPEEIAIILSQSIMIEGKYYLRSRFERIKLLDMFTVAQNYDKFPEQAKLTDEEKGVVKAGRNFPQTGHFCYFTDEQLRACGSLWNSSIEDSSSLTGSLSSSTISD